MILNAFLTFYRLLWIFFTPVVVIYLWIRGRRDPVYWRYLAERFGSYPTLPQHPVWIHAVSLGETRSAIPLARDLLAAGETVVFTHFTPVGRAEAQRAFGPQIAEGRVASVWVPLDMFWVFARFFHACRPKIGLTMEIEVWPAMIFASRRADVPLYMCNAQYPAPSMARDGRGLRLRQRVMTGVAGAFVKSQVQASRFASVGVPNIHVTGELRFDQPIPAEQINAAKTAFPRLNGRRVITIASAIEGEDDLYLDAMNAILQNDPATLFIYVPRAPERFDTVYQMLIAAGFRTARRSEVFGKTLELASVDHNWTRHCDVLFGDSLGEMYFYLALADRVVVGGGFMPAGAHNIIEPLALGKPVVTGPNTQTIEDAFVAANAAGVAISVPDGSGLTAALMSPDWATPDCIKTFMADHIGASARTAVAIMDAINGTWQKDD